MDINKNVWYIVNDTTCDEFITHMLTMGKPVEVSLVGSFDNEGRGSRRDIDLPFHRDGDYSSKIAKDNDQVFDKKVDIVGLYCLKSGPAKTLIKYKEQVSEVNLKQNQAIVFDNLKCLHGRRGTVGDRILLRIWIQRNKL